MLGGDPLDLGVFVDTQAHEEHLLPFGRRLGGALGLGVVLGLLAGSSKRVNALLVDIQR